MNSVRTAILCAGLLAISTSLATASPIMFHVDVNTAPLVGNPAGPFSIDFQLIDGSGTLAVPNTALLSNFLFAGGGPVGLATLIGGATGSLSSSVSLTDSGNFLNEFFQTFTPGSKFSFDVTLSRNPEAGPTPDSFSFAILDGSLGNIPTNGLGDSLVLVNIDSATLGLGDVRTFTSSSPAGVAATTAPLPEPASLILLGVGLVVGVGARRWHQQLARTQS